MKTKVKAAAIAVLEIVILLLGLNLVRQEYSYPVQTIDMPRESFLSHYIDTAGEWHLDEGQVQVPAGKTADVIYGPYMELPRGFYDLEIWYECESTQTARPFSNNSQIGLLRAGLFRLEHSRNHMTYSFAAADTVSNFELVFKYNGQGPFTISKVALKTSHRWALALFLGVVLALVLLDTALIAGQLSSKNRRSLLAVLVITLLASLPVLFQGLNLQDGQDLSFHLLRIENLAEAFSEGHFMPKIAPAWLGGYGYAVPVYRGDILLCFPALLRLCGLSINFSFKAFIVFINLVSTTAAMLCFCHMFKSRRTGALVTLAYMTAGYRMTELYVRSSADEFGSMLFFPLAACALWNMYTGENKGFRRNVGNAVLLAAAVSIVLTSHVASGLMLLLPLGLTALLLIRKTFTLNSLRTYGTAAFLTILLSAFFLVPYLDYSRSLPTNAVLRRAMNGPRLIGSSALAPGEYFAFFHNPYGGDQHMLCSPGIVLMAAVIAALFVCGIKGKKASGKIRFLTVLSLVMLWVPSTLFPWNFLSVRFPVFMDFAQQVQFPWRYLNLTILVLSVLLGCLLEENAQALLPPASAARIPAYIAVLSLVMVFCFTGHHADHAKRTMFYDTAELDTFQISTADYMPTNGEKLNPVRRSLYQGQFSSNGAEVQVLYRNGTDYIIACKTGNTVASVTAPLVYYEGYRAVTDSGKRLAVKASPDMFLSFTLLQQFDGNIRIYFEEPASWRIADGISLAAFGACVVYGLACLAGKGRTRKKEKAPEKAVQS